MNDDIKTRNDFFPEVPSKPTTTPPEAKIIQAHWHGVQSILIPAMCLGSMKLGFEYGGHLFAVVVLYMIGARAGAQKPEGLPDIQEMMRIIVSRIK